MSEDLEGLLRAELAGRAEAVPPSLDDSLADAAIGGALRLRRRRRVGAAAGGLGLVVLGAFTVMWTPWAGGEQTDGPVAATSADEAQSELAIEFVVQRGDGYGIVNTDDEFVPLPGDGEPYSVDRLDGAYAVTSQESRTVEVVSLDGTESIGFEAPDADYFYTLVRSDGEGFAVSAQHPESNSQQFDIYPGEIPREPEGALTMELGYEVNLEDWDDEYVVLSADLYSTTGGATGGPYWFNDQFGWGLETVADAGYEAAIITDMTEPNHVCVSDLQPGSSDVGSEQCGYLEDGGTDELITTASRDEAATEVAAEVSASMFAQEEDVYESPEFTERLEAGEFLFDDPQGRWQLGFSAMDETWTLLDASGEEPLISNLTPPEGALFPVMSHS
ncbi:hypothetical protein [Glycomyces tarimensis]